MDQFIEGKVIVVTGAGSGFGRLISQKCAALGARLVCADINDDSLNETVATISGAGGAAVTQNTDVSRYEDVRRLAARAVDEFGAIDVMVNNLDPDSLTDQVVHAINQPWGVAIAEITVRAAGEGFIL